MKDTYYAALMKEHLFQKYSERHEDAWVFLFFGIFCLCVCVWGGGGLW